MMSLIMLIFCSNQAVFVQLCPPGVGPTRLSQTMSFGDVGGATVIREVLSVTCHAEVTGRPMACHFLSISHVLCIGPLLALIAPH